MVEQELASRAKKSREDEYTLIFIIASRDLRGRFNIKWKPCVRNCSGDFEPKKLEISLFENKRILDLGGFGGQCFLQIIQFIGFVLSIALQSYHVCANNERDGVSYFHRLKSQLTISADSDLPLKLDLTRGTNINAIDIIGFARIPGAGWQ